MTGPVASNARAPHTRGEVGGGTRERTHEMEAAPDGERSAQGDAYRHLLGEIRTGRLVGGTHVVAESVADRLGISRIPVREAIRQLASEGFMTIRSNRGAVVTPLSGDEVIELYEMRAVLEGLAMRFVAKAIDERGFAEAEHALLQLDRARSDPDWFIAAHNSFHDSLMRFCHRRRLVRDVTRIRTATEPYLRMTMRMSPTAYANTTAEHACVLAVLRRRDPDAAESEMREHILATDILNILAATPPRD